MNRALLVLSSAALLGVCGLSACAEDEEPGFEEPGLHVGDPDVEAAWDQYREGICGPINEADSLNVIDRSSVINFVLAEADLPIDQEAVIRQLIERDC